MNSKILNTDFYLRRDVVAQAKELLGKVLHTRIHGKHTSGIIIETEAYAGIKDKGSHAYGGRRTQRTQIMYNAGGCAYIYLCYGMHHLFNVVTSIADEPHAILIRSIIPFQGTEIMQSRTKKEIIKPVDGIGPGRVSKLLGINKLQTGKLLENNLNSDVCIWISDEGYMLEPEDIIITPRIGIAYAAEDALLPYRFVWNKKNKVPFSGNFIF